MTSSQTVVLDCCYAGSGTRRDCESSATLVRGIDLPNDYHVLSSIDSAIISESGPRAERILAGFQKSALQSHILLAACTAEQRSRETNRGGFFTTALLGFLRARAIENVMYEDLITGPPNIVA